MANATTTELPAQTWHTMLSEATTEQLKTDQLNGLTQTEAKARLAKSGPNTLTQAKQRTTFEIFLSQFRSLIVLLLAAATAIAFAMGDKIEAIAILIVIVINAAIGFFTEWKAAHALSKVESFMATSSVLSTIYFHATSRKS